jgi:hypothetical protein
MYINQNLIKNVIVEISKDEDYKAFLEIAMLLCSEDNIDPKEIKRKAQIYISSRDKRLLELDMIKNGYAEFLGRILAWTVKDKSIEARLDNGLKVSIPLELFENETSYEIYRIMQQLLEMEIVKRRVKNQEGLNMWLEH